MVQECGEPAALSGILTFLIVGLVLVVWGFLNNVPLKQSMRKTAVLTLSAVALPLFIPIIFWMVGAIMLSIG
ncbi:hypothetical protein AUQ41_15150 [Thalassospira sp. MCCC 1A02898]|nr:hypothetical protein AUQ41_15150 [Thalassospira sp. MCCC 1A02898]